MLFRRARKCTADEPLSEGVDVIKGGGRSSFPYDESASPGLFALSNTLMAAGAAAALTPSSHKRRRQSTGDLAAASLAASAALLPPSSSAVGQAASGVAQIHLGEASSSMEDPMIGGAGAAAAAGAASLDRRASLPVYSLGFGGRLHAAASSGVVLSSAAMLQRGSSAGVAAAVASLQQREDGTLAVDASAATAGRDIKRQRQRTPSCVIGAADDAGPFSDDDDGDEM